MKHPHLSTIFATAAIIVFMVAIPLVFLKKKQAQSEQQKTKSVTEVVTKSRLKLYKSYDCETLVVCYTLRHKEGVSCIKLNTTPEECKQ